MWSTGRWRPRWLLFWTPEWPGALARPHRWWTGSSRRFTSGGASTRCDQSWPDSSRVVPLCRLRASRIMQPARASDARRHSGQGRPPPALVDHLDIVAVLGPVTIDEQHANALRASCDDAASSESTVTFLRPAQC